MVYILKSDENTRGDLYDHVNPVQAECIDMPATMYLINLKNKVVFT